MSVFFNRPAVTFAEAPFQLSAETISTVVSFFGAYAQYRCST